LSIKKYILINGYVGSLGAARFASAHLNELYARFRKDYVDSQLRILNEDIGDCEYPYGVTKEFYRIAHEEKMGFEIDLRSIPVRQFTIEICELFGLSPFDIESSCNIIVSEENEGKKIPGKCVGHTSQGLDLTFLRLAHPKRR